VISRFQGLLSNGSARTATARGTRRLRGRWRRSACSAATAPALTSVGSSPSLPIPPSPSLRPQTTFCTLIRRDLLVSKPWKHFCFKAFQPALFKPCNPCLSSLSTFRRAGVADGPAPQRHGGGAGARRGAGHRQKHAHGGAVQVEFS
jgi:hypothetical protein